MTNEQRALASEVLRIVDQKHTEKSGPTVIVKPGTVVRVEEKPAGTGRETSVIFACFPFLEEAETPLTKKETAATYRSFFRITPSRSYFSAMPHPDCTWNCSQELMQFYYPFAWLQNHDRDQVVTQCRVLGQGKYLQVSQFWALSFGDGEYLYLSTLLTVFLTSPCNTCGWWPGAYRGTYYYHDPKTLKTS